MKTERSFRFKNEGKKNNPDSRSHFFSIAILSMIVSLSEDLHNSRTETIRVLFTMT